ncbi:MAG: FAD-dependent monooxygenase [Deltaproteobacteria bacterium]|nr:FAD-dependent monooxygenase [Deltaproteobacteria bacterium]
MKPSWYIIPPIKLNYNFTIESLKKNIASTAGISVSDIHDLEIEKISIDARKKVSKVVCCRILTHAELEHYENWTPQPLLNIPDLSRTEGAIKVIIAGFGPAGIGAAWLLSHAGCQVTVLERGGPVPQRSKAWGLFMKDGIFRTDASLAFGEGGAGTFSDGKLNTRRNNPVYWNLFKRMMISGGVSTQVFVKAHPHIGTDVLQKTIPVIRNRLKSLGVSFFWNNPLSDFQSHTRGVTCYTPDGEIHADYLILATGGNAYNIPDIIQKKGVQIQSRHLQMGVRIEHTAQEINKARYGTFSKETAYDAAEYNFVHKTSGIRTFCMCPGGEIVCASTEEGSLTINGMSNSHRNSRFSNSALISNIPVSSWKDGINLVSRIEKDCFTAGGSDYSAPFQLVKDFLKGQLSPETETSYRRGLKSNDLNRLLPNSYTSNLQKALGSLNLFLPGVTDGTLIAPETRVTPPWRYERDENGWILPGVMTAGEGSGWSSGISTSSMDGMKIAHNLLIKISDQMKISEGKTVTI